MPALYFRVIIEGVSEMSEVNFQEVSSPSMEDTVIITNLRIYL